MRFFRCLAVRLAHVALFAFALSLFLSQPANADSHSKSKTPTLHANAVDKLRSVKTKRKLGVKRDPFAKFDPSKMEALVSCGPKNGTKKLTGSYRLVRKSKVKRAGGFQASGAGGNGPQIEKIRSCGQPENCIDLVILGDGFTASQLPTFRSTVRDIDLVLFQHAPFKEYASYFNVYRLDLISNVGGVTCDARDNALGSRLLCGVEGGPYVSVDSNRAYSAAALVEGVDKYLVVVNSYQGRANASVGGMYASTTMQLAGHIAVHELGHSIGGLADEYQEGNAGRPYDGEEPRYPNISKHNAQQMQERDLKWAAWFSQPYHGTFEGVGAYRKGLYRPTISSVMRTIGDVFNAPGRESLIMNFYKFAKPFAASPGENRDFDNPIDGAQNFSIQPLSGSTQFEVKWYLDYQEIEGANGLTYNPDSLLTGFNGAELRAKIVDKTPWVRDSFRDEHASKTFSWWIASRSSRPLKITKDIDPHYIVTPGGSLGFSLELSGGAYEGIEYEWFKDGKSIYKEEPRRNYYHNFFIDSVTAADSGRYVMVARSGGSEVRSTESFVEVRQAKNYTVFGRVTDATGVGVAGIAIHGLPELPFTTADGTYSVKVREGYYKMMAFKDGLKFNPANINVDITADTEVNFTVDDGRATYVLSGKITSSDGNPIAGVSLDTQSTFGQVVTDAQGNYVFPAALNGTSFLLTPILDGYSFSPTTVSVTLGSDTTANFVGSPVPVTGQRYTLSGRVVLSGGQTGISGIRISGGATLGEVTTGADGSFNFGSFPSGTSYTIRAIGDSYTFSPSDFSGRLTANASVTFTANPITTAQYIIRGRVVLSGTNSGVSGLSVTASPSIGQTTTDAQGRFQFSGINRGTHYEVRVSGTGYTITPQERAGTLNSTVDLSFTASREIDSGVACYGAMVDYLYAQIPHSSPGAARATLANDLASGSTTPAELVDLLTTSATFVNHSAPAMRLYQFLGENSSRPPDVDGTEHFRSRLANGESIQSAVKSIIESGEFRTKYPNLSPQAFTVRIYLNALGRLPSIPDVDYWRAQLNAGSSRENVAARIGMFSDESIRKQAFTIYAQALPITLHAQNPMSAETTLLADLLRSATVTRLEAVDAFIYSDGFPFRCGSMNLGQMASYDSDRNGALSAAERQAWFNYLRQLRGGGTAPRWQNPVNRFDVNNDGRITNIDALNIGNEINRSGAHELPQNATPNYYYDVDGDGWITSSDYDAVIEKLA